MLDALELSGVLTSSQCNTIESAISEYEKNMFKRASKIAQESLENGERMHSENALTTMLDFFNSHKDVLKKFYK